MRVLVAGATGAIGRPLVAALQGRGHEVTGLVRDGAGADRVRRAGGEPLVADVLDGEALGAAVHEGRPDVVVDELTALPRRYTPQLMRAASAANAAVRTVGGDHLYAASVRAGAGRWVTQSGCYFYQPGDGLAEETEPWVDDAPPLVAETLRVLRTVEARALGPDRALAGVVLRYGFFYGPGTWFHPDGDVADQVRGGGYPVLGTGAGRWSWVHIDDAVAATVAAVESDVTGAFNVCDDDPAPLHEWLPAFAAVLGAPSPPRVPVTPDTDPDGRFYAEELRGAANQRARAELGLSPRPLTWLSAGAPVADALTAGPVARGSGGGREPAGARPSRAAGPSRTRESYGRDVSTAGPGFVPGAPPSPVPSSAGVGSDHRGGGARGPIAPVPAREEE
jgi:nucleoside-diphosphate-sugar epimerase